MESTLAAREDAVTILKLYELRQEAVLRRARTWLTVEFWPNSAEDVRAILGDFGSETNCWLRQVTSYWEMATALVNHGILAPDLFIDTNGEPFFIAAKFWPHLPEIRASSPGFLTQMEKRAERSGQARQRLETAQAAVAKRMAARAKP